LELYAIDLELRRRRYRDALARLDQIAARSQRKETWLARRGEILADAGRLSEARATYRQALAAIEALPEGARHTRATLELEGRLKAALAPPTVSQHRRVRR
jgi:predicted negative regulator of RcsB-dependent stress response